VAAPIAEGPGFGGARSPSHPSESNRWRVGRRPGESARPRLTARRRRDLAVAARRLGDGTPLRSPGGERGGLRCRIDSGSTSGDRFLSDRFLVGMSSRPRRLCSYPPSWEARNPRGDPAASPYRATRAGVRDATRATLTRLPRWSSHVSNGPARRHRPDRGQNRGSAGRPGPALDSCLFLSSLVR